MTGGVPYRSLADLAATTDFHRMRFSNPEWRKQHFPDFRFLTVEEFEMVSGEPFSRARKRFVARDNSEVARLNRACNSLPVPRASVA